MIKLSVASLPRLGSDKSLNTNTHLEYVKCLPKLSQKTFENFVAMTSDNCDTNITLSNLVNGEF